ncbi:MAG: hypothetical protein SFW35_01755 [Chitinophagales bacterium]|nr:hypothetical protein [Chitinophagales bacterium]
MKTIFIHTFATVAVAAVLFTGCKKDDDDNNNNAYTCTTCVQSPDALAANDASSAGVYKGTLLGSSGTINLVLLNGGTTTTAYVNFDGGTATLTTNDLSQWTAGQPINNALFTGVTSPNGDTVSAYFSVDANGQNPTVNVTIPGHTVVVALYKELSTALVKAFEGTYTGDLQGGFNVILQGNNYTILNDNGAADENTLVNGRIEYTTPGGTVIDGEFTDADNANGTWTETDGDNGTWQFRRTL